MKYIKKFNESLDMTKESFEEQRKFVSLAGPWHTDLGIIHLPGSVDQSGLPPRNADTLTTTRLTRLHPYVGVMEYVREVDIPGSLGDKMIKPEVNLTVELKATK